MHNPWSCSFVFSQSLNRNSKIFLRVEQEAKIPFVSIESTILCFLRSGCENLKEERGGIQDFNYYRPANGSLMQSGIGFPLMNGKEGVT